MKKVVRLTEDKLRKMIAEAVKGILKENKIPNPMGGPESRINAYPEYAKDFEDEEPISPIPNKQRLHTLDRTTDAFGDWEKGDHAYYQDGEVYPSAEWTDTNMYGKPNHYSQWAKDADEELEKMQNQRFKNSLDKQWQNTKDIEKYTKQADSRPLHRKGSLNRVGMDENVIRKLVSESIKKVLNEKWYPEEEDDISDYSFGMIAKLSTRSLMQLDEETIARLEQVNEENIETESSYVSVMVRNVNASCDEDGDCTLTIECAVSAPDMPINEIEQEVEEILWYWVENITGQSLVAGFDWESEDTVFDRRSRNK